MQTGIIHKTKKLVCLLLVLCMVFSIMPTGVLAAGTESEQPAAGETITPEVEVTPEATPKVAAEQAETEAGTTAPVTGQDLMTPSPFALEDISDYFTVSLSTNTSFQTYDIPSGTPVQKLPVTLKITTKLETSISGGKILLPLVPEAPNGNTYFHYDSCDSIASNLLIDSVAEVDTDGDGVNDALEITLKDTVPANTQVTFMAYYEMGSAYKSQVMEGAIMWEDVTATLQMDGADDGTAVGGTVKTDAIDHRNVSGRLISPSTENGDGTITITPDSIISFTSVINNSNPYKIDFVEGSIPTARIYFPVGTTVSSVPSEWSLVSLNPEDDRICYERILPTDASQWPVFNAGGNIGSTYANDGWNCKFPYVAEGTALPVLLEFAYQLIGDVDASGIQNTTTKTHTINYVMGVDLAWDFYTSNSHTNNDASYITISGISDGDIAGMTCYAFTSTSYLDIRTSRNRGTVDVEGVSLGLIQPTSDTVINFNMMQIVATRETTDVPWNSYNYELNIANAQTSSSRIVSGSMTPNSTATIQYLNILSNSILTLTVGEYIESVTVTPVNTNGDVGNLMPKNGFGLRYQHKAWNGQKWPSGESVPSESTKIIMSATLKYYEEDGIPQSVSKDYAVYYAERPVLPIVQYINTDASGQNKNPGDILSYQLNLYNYNRAARYSWENPIIAFKAPRYLQLMDVSEGSFTEYYDSAGDFYYYILQLDNDIPLGALAQKTVDLSFKIADGAAQGNYTFERVWVASDTNYMMLM